MTRNTLKRFKKYKSNNALLKISVSDDLIEEVCPMCEGELFQVGETGIGSHIVEYWECLNCGWEVQKEYEIEKNDTSS